MAGEVPGRGRDALVAKPVPGRPPKLSGAQIARLYEWIVGSDPAQFSFEFALWTREMVRQVIRREFKVALSVVSVGRLLRTMGLSPQRPLYRAYQQNPEAVQRWKGAVPGHPQAGQGRGATIYFADEAGIRSDYHAGTTWAPVGRTPVVKAPVPGSRSTCSPRSPRRARCGSGPRGHLNAAVFIDFCKRLLRDTSGPVYLVVDGHPAHRARATTEFVASTEGRLKLFLLPAYSPELNPDEWVWKNVKHDRSARPP